LRSSRRGDARGWSGRLAGQKSQRLDISAAGDELQNVPAASASPSGTIDRGKSGKESNSSSPPPPRRAREGIEISKSPRFRAPPGLFRKLPPDPYPSCFLHHGREPEEHAGDLSSLPACGKRRLRYNGTRPNAKEATCKLKANLQLPCTREAQRPLPSPLRAAQPPEEKRRGAGFTWGTLNRKEGRERKPERK
jgi:hypothetical protein